MTLPNDINIRYHSYLKKERRAIPKMLESSP